MVDGDDDQWWPIRVRIIKQSTERLEIGGNWHGNVIPATPPKHDSGVVEPPWRSQYEDIKDNENENNKHRSAAGNEKK